MRLMEGVELSIAEALLDEKDEENRQSLKAQLEFWQTARAVTERHMDSPSMGMNYVFDGAAVLLGLLLLLSDSEKETFENLLNTATQHRDQINAMLNSELARATESHEVLEALLEHFYGYKGETSH